jgi:hypothetical protein
MNQKIEGPETLALRARQLRHSGDCFAERGDVETSDRCFSEGALYEIAAQLAQLRLALEGAVCQLAQLRLTLEGAVSHLAVIAEVRGPKRHIKRTVMR